MSDPFDKLLCFGLGAALVAVFGWMGIDAWRDYRTFGDTPTRSTLSAAIDSASSGRRWVSVEDAPWRCGELVTQVRGGAAFLPASTEDGATAVARFDHAIQCQALARRPLVGVIEPMTLERAADLRAAGMPLPGGARLRTLDVCAFCGKSNARLGVIVCGGFVLLGLSLYPLLRVYRRWRERAAAALQAAIHAPPARAAAADRTVRIWGGAALATGVAAFTVAEGWVAYGVVPVRWIAVVAVLLGGWMVASPAAYRRFSARAKRR